MKIPSTRVTKSSKQGFTMIELMAGIALFATALFSVMLVLGESLVFGKTAQNRSIAMNEARRVVEDIRRVADTSGLAALPALTYTGTALSDEIITVADLNGQSLVNNADPLPIQVTITWAEKGKTNKYRVETQVTDR